MNLPIQTPAPDAPPTSRARAALLKRLADVVSLPISRVNAFERAMTADLLVDMLREAEPAERKKVARRVAGLSEIPASLVRLFLRDEVEVAEELLANSAALSDADLLDCARTMNLEHRRLIALRRPVSEVVCDVLIEAGEVLILECLLRNDEARFSNAGIEAVVALTRGDPRLTSILLRRPELKPAHAYVLFWWADPAGRRVILQRFAVSREILQDAASDIFPMADSEGWFDPLSRKALQFIDARQRRDEAIGAGPFDDLEAAVQAAEERGLTREIADEISYLAGVKPMTGARIFADPGGEPLAILCKAAALPRTAISALWRAQRRGELEADGAPSAALERTIAAYDTISLDRAQTVLRYWNWSLTSALTPALLRAVRDGDEDVADEYSLG